MEDAKRFAIMSGSHRTWAVASIHGESEKLADLHQLIAEKYRIGDKLVYMGNILGVGSKVKDTVNELLTFRRAVIANEGASPDDVIYLKGAQEEMWRKLLELQFAPSPKQILPWLLDMGVGATIEAYGGSTSEAKHVVEGGSVVISRWTSALRRTQNSTDGHGEFMNSLKHAAISLDNKMVFVSAGVNYSKSLENQKDSFWWGSKEIFDREEPYLDYKMVVRGYSPEEIPEPVINKYSATIDCGCGYGGKLAAVLFDVDGTPICKELV